MRWSSVIRKSAKWGGTATVLLLATAWLGSLLWGVTWCPDGKYAAQCHRGDLLITFRVHVGAYLPGWHVFPAHPESRSSNTSRTHWFELRSGPGGGSLSLPLWPFVVCASMTAVVAWCVNRRASNRADGAVCPACGYNLTCLASGSPCPECGVKPGAA